MDFPAVILRLEFSLRKQLMFSASSQLEQSLEFYLTTDLFDVCL